VSTLTALRTQTAVSLVFHLVFAVFGVGLPFLALYAERRWITTRDPVWLALARKWSKALGLLFAVGAVSGTVLSFEFGLLWPRFLGVFGGVVGLPFELETYAFFLEAIFIGLYLYGWNRMSPRAHWWTGVPVAVSGLASAVFIVAANAWMNTPTGFRLSHGRVIAADPWRALINPDMPQETVHLIIASLLAASLGTASVYAVGMLRGRTDAYHRRGATVGLVGGLALAPVQLISGDFSARAVAANQPLKLAAIEGIGRSRSHVPLSIGGVYDQHRHALVGAIRIPDGLSLLLDGSPKGFVRGLESAPAADRPSLVTEIHLAFDTMVGVGMLLIATGMLALVVRRRLGSGWLQHRLLLIAAAVGGPAALLAVEAGWFVTELGRQPWLVYNRLRVADAGGAVSHGSLVLIATIVIYTALTATLVRLLRRMTAVGTVIRPGPDHPGRRRSNPRRTAAAPRR
jgi:cytochrome d ubiquinol oxidase subunit I